MPQRPFVAVGSANAEWSGDYKGWFRTGDGRRVDPLTITDSHSRFLIAVPASESTTFELTLLVNWPSVVPAR